MNEITANRFRDQLKAEVDRAIREHRPLRVTRRRGGDFVVGSADDWSAIEARIAREVMPNLVGRIARTDEVADLVAFLASPRAGFITGMNIRIDGGSVDYVT